VTARTGADLIGVSGVLDIGNVSSVVTMTARAGEPPKISSNFDMGTATLLGHRSGLTGSSVSVFDMQTPVSLSPSTVQALNQALAPAGISVAYLPASYGYTDGSTSTGAAPDGAKTVKSITSGALDVKVEHNVPQQGDVTTEYILGRAVVAAALSSDIPSSAPSDLPGGAGVPLGTGENPALGGSAAVPNGQSAGALGSSLGNGTSGGAPPNRRLSTGPAALGRAPLASYSGQGVYLILVLAGLLAVAGSAVMRFLGVRLYLFRSPPT
jgi:hypothetical protein